MMLLGLNVQSNGYTVIVLVCEHMSAWVRVPAVRLSGYCRRALIRQLAIQGKFTA